MNRSYCEICIIAYVRPICDQQITQLSLATAIGPEQYWFEAVRSSWRERSLCGLWTGEGCVELSGFDCHLTQYRTVCYSETDVKCQVNSRVFPQQESKCWKQWQASAAVRDIYVNSNRYEIAVPRKTTYIWYRMNESQRLRGYSIHSIRLTWEIHLCSTDFAANL